LIGKILRFKKNNRGDHRRQDPGTLALNTNNIESVVQNNSSSFGTGGGGKERKKMMTTISRGDEDDDVEATPLLSNNKYIKRRGNFTTSFRKGGVFFVLILMVAALMMTMTTTRTSGLSALRRLGGGGQQQQVKTVVPDEDELTKQEKDKIDFFLEERRKELVKEAVAKHAREQAKKDSLAAAEASSKASSSNNKSENNNSNSNNSKNKNASAGSGSNGGESNGGDDKKNGIVNVNNNNNNNNNGKKGENGNAKNTATSGTGSVVSSAKVGADEKNNIASTSTFTPSSNNNTNAKNSGGSASPTTTTPADAKPKQQPKQQQPKQQQQQHVQKNATTTTTNNNSNNNNNNIKKGVVEVAPHAKAVVTDAAVIVKDVAKGIVDNIADGTFHIDDDDDNGKVDASDEKYKPNPVSPVRFLDHASNNAKCLDGSPPAYYLSKRVDRAVRRKRCTSDGVEHSCGETWIIMLSGGGTCVNDEDCTRRAATGLGSSKLVPRTYHFSTGIQSVLKSNEAFNTANMVNIAYCSGDSWLGRSSEPDASGVTMNGGLIVDAVLDELINHHDLLSAKNIIFSGKSAGGVGLVAQIDRWADVIAQAYEAQGYDPKLQPPKVSGIAFAGFHYFHTHTFYDPRDQMSIGENKNSDDDSKDDDKEEASKDNHSAKSNKEEEEEEEFESMKFDEMVEQIFEENAEEDTLSSALVTDDDDALVEKATPPADNNNKNNNKKSNEKNASATDDDDKTKANASTATTSTTSSSDKEETGIFSEIFSTFKDKLQDKFRHAAAELGESDDDQKSEDGVYLNSAESRLLLRFGLNTTNSTNIYGQMKPSFIPWDETSWKKYLKFWRAEDSLPSECTKRGSNRKVHRCAVARNSIKFIRTPIFFVQALTDSVVMSIHDNWPLADHRFVHEPDLKSMTLASSTTKHLSDVHEKRKQTQRLVEKTIDDLNSGVLDMKVYEDKQLELTKKMWENLDEEERSRREEYAKMWKTQMVDRLREATKANPNVGVFAPSCYVHTKFDKIKIDGVEARSALAKWVYDGERTIVIDDKCDANGKGLFCNQSCQDTAPQLEKTNGGQIAPTTIVDNSRMGTDEAQQQKQATAVSSSSTKKQQQQQR
tara:strand:- start:985 stop:4314 length:3330 start_codon:yes stop_codon:yes gene_type:complete